MKKLFFLILVILLSFSLISCTNENSKVDSGGVDKSGSADEDDIPSEIAQGKLVPTFTIDWPSEVLPGDFPNLGKVTKVYDSRPFYKKITINWNIVSESQVNDIIDKLNAYLDYDHAWQGGFYSDGIKYKSGTEDEFINVVVRYSPSASGEMEPDFKPQFYLEITGQGIPD